MAFGPEHLQKMEEGIRLFNSQHYWECHESLEEIWLEDRPDPVRYVYWAVIQVAAAMIHYREKNLIGAKGLINKAREKFRKCHEHQQINDLVNKNLDWVELEGLVDEVPVEPSDLTPFAKLWEFRFKHYPFKE